MKILLLRLLAVVVIGSLASIATAQGLGRQMVAEEKTIEESESWYAEPTSPQQMTSRMIIQQKAQVRAQQRIARMESLKWYGFSAARPLSNATPFAGVPAPRYEMPGGRPFAWYPFRGTTVVIVE